MRAEVRAWGEAYRKLSGAPRAELDAGDLERLATCAYMIGEDEAAVAGWDAAHERYVRDGEAAEGARCAFWVAFCLMMQGQMAHASGWLSRTEGIIGDLDCSARGFLLIPALLRALDSNDPATAVNLAVRNQGRRSSVRRSRPRCLRDARPRAGTHRAR